MLSERRALTVAPLAIFPVALVFIIVRSLLMGDPRELLVSPLSVGMVTIVGYPLALATGFLLVRMIPVLARPHLVPILGAGLVTAELVFWLLVHPLWERQFSNVFCAALVAASGLATAGVYWLLRR